jgi:hypothetical protein
LRKAFLLGYIFGLQPDQAKSRRPRENNIHHTIWCLLLPSHALRPKECMSNLPEDDAKLPREPNRTQYIDNIVITTQKEESLITDLRETFNNLDRYKLKLNPTKCSFGVPAGQLLGFLVSARGLEANPEKIQAIFY